MEFPAASYSAFGEDRLIAKYIGRRSDGFYVDVGAHDPIEYSNTYALYLLGWRGLAIDPDPAAIAAFKEKRPGDKALATAIGASEGIVTLHLFNDRSMNTVDPDCFATFGANPKKRHLGDIQVPCRRLDDILAEHVPAGRSVDFLNVDCEGADLDVLKSNDWRRWRPPLIAVEDLKLDLARAADSAIFDFLAGLGYRLAAHLHLTSIYRLG
jgi:FkbM family methyltransferase